MSTNVASGTPAVAKTYPPQNFTRKLSGRKFLLVIGIFTLVVYLGAQLMIQARWAAYLNRIEPRENFASIIFDLRKFQKRTKELPADLSEAGKQKWTWAKDAVIDKTGISRRGNTVISKFQFRQYDYIYARLDENTAVFWATPIWVSPVPEPWYYDMYTHHNEQIGGFLEDWRKDKQTWFVVLYKDKVRAWQGALPEMSEGTKNLESILEPSGEMLQKRNLTETKAERWIK